MQIAGIADQRREHMIDKVLTCMGSLNQMLTPKQHAEMYFTLDASSADKGSFEDRGGARQQETLMVSDAISNQQLQQWSPHDDEHIPPPPAKKKRNLPGTPDPDTEVIALSLGTLMGPNRFVCEICGKGFQLDKNLQLHRREHNLPWKLKQRSSKEVVRKKVYICPVASCVHHDPSRALGDLTGIKKHYFRKHGEKRWKCDKCSKRYALQSDWKAHSKVCGTREYRCDCGSLFSRRDSFITHRALCDSLANKTAASGTDLAHEPIRPLPTIDEWFPPAGTSSPWGGAASSSTRATPLRKETLAQCVTARLGFSETSAPETHDASAVYED